MSDNNKTTNDEQGKEEGIFFLGQIDDDGHVPYLLTHAGESNDIRAFLCDHIRATHAGHEEIFVRAKVGAVLVTLGMSLIEGENPPNVVLVDNLEDMGITPVAVEDNSHIQA